MEAKVNKMEVMEIKDLHVSIDGKKILNGVNLSVKKGEVTALMGPNGSGKSTLSYTIMGHPKYTVDSGVVIWKGKNILEMLGITLSPIRLKCALLSLDTVKNSIHIYRNYVNKSSSNNGKLSN